MRRPRHEELPPGVMDRETFLKKVGFDSRTLSEWIKEGILKPITIGKGGQAAQGFSDADAQFAQDVRELQRARHGELTRREAAAVVRGEMKPPKPGHDPGRNRVTPFTG